MAIVITDLVSAPITSTSDGGVSGLFSSGTAFIFDHSAASGSEDLSVRYRFSTGYREQSISAASTSFSYEINSDTTTLVVDGTEWTQVDDAYWYSDDDDVYSVDGVVLTMAYYPSGTPTVTFSYRYTSDLQVGDLDYYLSDGVDITGTSILQRSYARKFDDWYYIDNISTGAGNNTLYLKFLTPNDLLGTINAQLDFVSVGQTTLTEYETSLDVDIRSHMPYNIQSYTTGTHMFYYYNSSAGAILNVTPDMHPNVKSYTFWENFQEYNTDDDPTALFYYSGTNLLTGSHIQYDESYESMIDPDKFLQISDPLEDGDYTIAVVNSELLEGNISYYDFTIET